MLSCKNCGAQMSGTDLVCKNCGTPWGKKHKSRKGLYFSILTIVAVGAVSYINYVPNAKENFLSFYNTVLASINNETPSKVETPENLASTNETTDTTPVETAKEDENTTTSENEVVPVPTEEKVSEPLPPTFTWLSASSSLKDYPTSFITDGKLETAWLEGVKGNGIGEWIMFSAENDQTVSKITLYNGYLKNDKVYVNNGKIKKLSLEFSDGEIITKDIPKQSYSEAKKGYTITLDTPKATSSVKITILSAYQGAYYTDTGISGISFE